MKSRLCLALLVSGLFLTGCASGILPPSTSTMKGMEIYSWQTAGGTWNYALLSGTNRQKTVAEVTDPAGALTCSCQLKTQLEKLPAGTYVTWITSLPGDTNQVLGLPPQDVVNDITAFCQQHQLNLQIVSF